MSVNFSDHLIEINGRYFELIGYANSYDIKEINASFVNYNDLTHYKDSRSIYQRLKLNQFNLTQNELLDANVEDLLYSFNAESIKNKLKRDTIITINNKHSSSRSDYLEKILLDLLNLKPKKHVLHSVGYGYYLIFKLYQKPIDLFTQKLIAKNNFFEVAKNYILKNKFIPLIASPNRAIDIFEKNESVKVINLDLLNRIFNKKTLVKKENYLTKNEQENESFFKENNYDILELKKLACIKCGYIDFKYKEKDYKLALLPLLSVTKSDNNEIFEYDKFTWFFSNIKINHHKGFNQPLTDLFLCSDIPLEFINNNDFIKEIEKLSLSYQN